MIKTDMFALLAVAIIGVVVGLFAMQNSQTVAFNFAMYHFDNIPIYVVVLFTLLLGFAISSVISAFNSFFTARTIRKKDRTLKDTEQDKADLVRQIHKLELENQRLKEENGTTDDKSL